MSSRLPQDVIDLIIRAGLYEDFIAWLRSKGIDLEARRPAELDASLIEEYARGKGLLEEGDELEFIEKEPDDGVERLEPLEIKPSTPPRRT
ncbi:MAG: hypothetical protein QI199_00995 [Candidatus Korarchaeota archaeon]|nr:hypothetical protein [Candidatus Korarchaeota archaeon]